MNQYKTNHCPSIFGLAFILVVFFAQSFSAYRQAKFVCQNKQSPLVPFFEVFIYETDYQASRRKLYEDRKWISETQGLTYYQIIHRLRKPAKRQWQKIDTIIAPLTLPASVTINPLKFISLANMDNNRRYQLRRQIVKAGDAGQRCIQYSNEDERDEKVFILLFVTSVPKAAQSYINYVISKVASATLMARRLRKLPLREDPENVGWMARFASVCVLFGLGYILQNFCLCRDKTAAFRQGLFLQIQTMQALQSLQQRHNSLKSELSEAQQVLQFLDSLEERLNADKKKPENANNDDFKNDQIILDKLQIGYDFDKQIAAGHVSKSKIAWMIAFTALSFIFFRRAFGSNGLSLDI